VLNRRGLALGICCHPYDVCTELIAREVGVIVTDVLGAPLRAPLDTEAEVTWAGYANRHIRDQVEPLLKQALISRGLIDPSA
ncbi:MAG TPA: inositol monophosphatase, partial [Blastocatellia bacterium]|nr:inositol monophosphatase [Blastocatellia bacterium]